MNAHLLPVLQEKRFDSIDLIYSRHVLEQHSIEARILLKHDGFKEAIRSNQFGDLPETFPASPRNILAVFQECYRILKPGGAIITQIAKKKYGVLTETHLQTFQPEALRIVDIERFSQLITFVK